MKKQTFLILFTLSLSLLFFIQLPLASQENKLRVTAERVNIYIDPDINSPVIETAHKGDVLTLLSPRKQKDTWYYISFFSGTRNIIVSGFVLDSSVGAISGEAAEELKTKEVLFEYPREVEVILEQANVRAEPKFESQVLQQVQVGMTLLSIAKEGDWYKVTLPPDEKGNVVIGYVHQSFVEPLYKEEAPKAGVKEQVISPAPELGAGKARYNYLKAGANYFQFAAGSRRTTYGNVVNYEAEVSVSFWKNLEAWVGSNYLYLSKSGSRIKVFPVGAGVKYRLSSGIFNIYGGAGVNYLKYEESGLARNERKEEVGYIAKLGAFVKIKWGFILDFHFNYSYCYLKLTSGNVNIGGPEAGICLGYLF